MRTPATLILAATIILSLEAGGNRADASNDPDTPLPVKTQNVGTSVQALTESKQPTPNRQTRERIETAILAPDGFIIKDGAAYYSVTGVLLPVPGGGASGCFGDASAKNVVFKKPVVLPSITLYPHR